MYFILPTHSKISVRSFLYRPTAQYYVNRHEFSRHKYQTHSTHVLQDLKKHCLSFIACWHCKNVFFKLSLFKIVKKWLCKSGQCDRAQEQSAVRVLERVFVKATIYLKHCKSVCKYTRLFFICVICTILKNNNRQMTKKDVDLECCKVISKKLYLPQRF